MIQIAKGTPVRVVGGRHDLERATYVRPGAGGYHFVAIRVWVTEERRWVENVTVLVPGVMLLPGKPSPLRPLT